MYLGKFIKFHDMSSYILEILIRELYWMKNLRFKSTNQPKLKKVQLIATIRFVYKSFIKYHYLFYKEVSRELLLNKLFK